MVLRASESSVLFDCPKIRFAISVTPPHRQTTGLARNNTNDTNKASKLCMTLLVGADVGHHHEAQHDHDDYVCCVGDGPEIATGTGKELNTQRDDRIAQRWSICNHSRCRQSSTRESQRSLRPVSGVPKSTTINRDGQREIHHVNHHVDK